MPNITSAKKYKHLVDTGGTGNVHELSRETGPYRHVVFDGNHYVSGRDGRLVWNAQAQPIKPTPTDIINAALNGFRQ